MEYRQAPDRGGEGEHRAEASLLIALDRNSSNGVATKYGALGVIAERFNFSDQDGATATTIKVKLRAITPDKSRSIFIGPIEVIDSSLPFASQQKLSGDRLHKNVIPAIENPSKLGSTW